MSNYGLSPGLALIPPNSSSLGGVAAMDPSLVPQLQSGQSLNAQTQLDTIAQTKAQQQVEDLEVRSTIEQGYDSAAQTIGAQDDSASQNFLGTIIAEEKKGLDNVSKAV